MVLLILARLTNRPTPGLAIEGRTLPGLGPWGPLSSAPHGRPSPSGQPKRVLLTGVEVQGSRQTTWMGQVLSRLLTPHLPLSQGPEQVTSPSPEEKEEDIADDVTKGVGAGEDKDL